VPRGAAVSSHTGTIAHSHLRFGLALRGSRPPSRRFAHRIASHRIASHRIASHRTALLRIASHYSADLRFLPSFFLLDFALFSFFPFFFLLFLSLSFFSLRRRFLDGRFDLSSSSSSSRHISRSSQLAWAAEVAPLNGYE